MGYSKAKLRSNCEEVPLDSDHSEQQTNIYLRELQSNILSNILVLQVPWVYKIE